MKDLDTPDTIWNDPEGGPILRRVSETFIALGKARAKFSRCTREDSRRAAEKAMNAAEVAYRKAADERDRFVEIFNARQMQRSAR